MTQIFWLASYPKSGNTWLRAFLANYLRGDRLPVDINALPELSYGDMRAEYYEQIAGKKAADLTWPEINRLRPQVHRLLAAARPGAVFVKTHSVLTTLDGVPVITPDVTSGAIYVVRNPLDVVVSFGHHYGLSMDKAVLAICFNGLKTTPQPGHVVQVLSDWSTHVKSWTKSPGLRCRMIRYEDLVTSPNRAFGEILDFLGTPKDREKLKRAIRHSSFKVLAEQERRSGFVEQSRKSERFFRRGGIGGWRKELTDQQAEHIVGCHRLMMTELGYLSPEGGLLV